MISAVKYRVVLVIDQERMAGDRDRANAVEVRVFADDLFIGVVDVHVADRVARFTPFAIAGPLIGDDRDVSGERVGSPVGSGVGRGVAWPAGEIGGGVSPPRTRKIGSVEAVGFGVPEEPAAGSRPALAGKWLGVGFNWGCRCRAACGMIGGPGVAGGEDSGTSWATTLGATPLCGPSVCAAPVCVSSV